MLGPGVDSFSSVFQRTIDKAEASLLGRFGGRLRHADPEPPCQRVYCLSDTVGCRSGLLAARSKAEIGVLHWGRNAFRHRPLVLLLYLRAFSRQIFSCL